MTGRNDRGTEGSGPPRADTIMVLHASLTSFRKLSIPRDTYAEIPDFGSQKINGAFSPATRRSNGATRPLTIDTVQNFLGIDINHVVIVDFDGFADFINTLGGITVDLPNKVCGDISGGKSQGGRVAEADRPASTRSRATRRWRWPDCARTSATPPRTTSTAPPASS